MSFRISCASGIPHQIRGDGPTANDEVNPEGLLRLQTSTPPWHVWKGPLWRSCPPLVPTLYLVLGSWCATGCGSEITLTEPHRRTKGSAGFPPSGRARTGSVTSPSCRPSAKTRRTRQAAAGNQNVRCQRRRSVPPQRQEYVKAPFPQLVSMSAMIDTIR